MGKEAINSASIRQLNKLRSEIISARCRWESIVKKNLIARRTAKGDSNLSPLKVLYIAQDGEWWKVINAEILNLKEKIAKPQNKSVKKQHSMWLPTVIERSKKIRLSAYSATSTKTISLSQARAYVKKAGEDAVLPSQINKDKKTKYQIRYYTGRNYKLIVTYLNGKKGKYSFTEWAVNICQNKSTMPLLRKASNISSLGSFEATGSICTRGKSALFAHTTSDTSQELNANDVVDDDANWK